MPDFMAPANILGMIAQGGGPYGPDWNAVNNNQRTAILQQKQQQEMEGVNALKWAYSDPSHYDPKTMQPTPEVMAGVMQRSPAAGMDLTNNLVALQQKRALLGNQQSTVMKHWHDRDLEIKKEAMDAYNGALDNGADPGKAQQIGQEVVSKGIETLKAEGLPPDMAQRVNPNFDALRYRRDLLTVPQQAAMENLKKEGYQVETQVINGLPTRVWVAPGKPTLDMAGKEITTTGTPAPTKASEPNLYTVTVPDRGQVTAVPDAGGFREYGGAGNLLPGATNPRKVGTKGEEDAATAGTPTGPIDKHGEEYITALPSSRASLVKGYAEGRVPFPGSFSLRSPYWQKMVADITQYDPTFDAVNYNTRASTRKDFTSGKSSQNITSVDTAIGHMGTLNKAVDQLNNSDFPYWNMGSNWLNYAGGNTRFQAAQKEFNTAKQAVATELTRAFRGTGGNVSDIKDWEKTLSDVDSPSSLHAAIGQGVELLASRINAMGEQYRRGMGTTADVTELLTPAAKRTLKALPNGEQILNDVGMRREGTHGEPAASPVAEAAPAASTPSAPAPSAAPHGDTIEPPGSPDVSHQMSPDLYWDARDKKVHKGKMPAEAGVSPNGAATSVTMTPTMSREDQVKAWGSAERGTVFHFPNGTTAVKP